MPVSLKQLFNAPVNHIPEIVAKKYFPVLDGFRGLAILFVVIGHLALYKPIGKYVSGAEGVEMFFVLSGFLITTLLLKEKINKGNISLRNFYIRRVLRIVPVGYLYLIVLLIIYWVYNFQFSYMSFLGSFLYFRNIPLNYGNNKWATDHFWTLAIEEQFYLIFPFILVKGVNRYFKTIIFLIVALPVLLFLVYQNVGVFYSNYWIHKVALGIVILFDNGTIAILIGSALAILVFKGAIKPPASNSYFLSIIILIFAIAFRALVPVIMENPCINQIIYALLMASVLLLCLPGTDFLSQLLCNKWMVKLGVLSYSIYIWQQMFTKYQPWQHAFKYSGAWFFNMPLLLIVSCASYYLFERQFLNIKERFKA